MDFAAIHFRIFFYGLLQWMFQKNTLSKLVADPSDSMTVKAMPTVHPKETGGSKNAKEQ
jgi:hypothetical protein